MLALALVALPLAPLPASAAPRTLTFGLVADTFVRADQPTRSFGANTTLAVDNSPVKHILLRVTVTGVGTDVVTSAALRLYVTDPAPAGGSLNRVASQTWPEATTWLTEPAADPTPISSVGKATKNTWVLFDLGALIHGDGTYSMRIVSTANDGATFTSREGAAAQRPQVVVTTATPDASAPQVALTAPVDGSAVVGAVALAATASDDIGVTGVDFAVDGTAVGTDTTAPYGLSWNSLAVPNGPHALTATARDAAGNATISAPVTVNVGNPVDTTPPDPPPDLTAAVDGPTQVTLTWSVPNDDVGVTGYEVSRNGTPIAMPATPGYVDRGAPPGSDLTYGVVALDGAGHRSDPATVSATTPPAPASFTFAAAGDHGANATADRTLANIDASPASLYLALGDMDYNETPTDQAWCDYVHQRLPTKGPAFPFELVTGNHEDDGGENGSIQNFAACLPDQANATVGPGSLYGAEYAFDYPAAAPLARFLMLSPELTVAGTAYHYTPGSPAYQWVADTIDQARSAGIRWIIVGYHYPCLTAGKYACASGSDLFNLLVAKHVDLVLNGHEHNYQRSKQVGLDAVGCPSIAATGYNPGCVTDDGLDGVYPKDAGTVEVVAGTFGRGLYSVSSTDPEAPYMVSMNGTTHGFVQYTVAADRLDASFVRSEGTFSDSFSIVRGAPAIADHTPPTTPATVSADTSTPGTVRLSWSPSTDAGGIGFYSVIRDGAVIGTTTATTFTDGLVAPGLTSTYTIVAYDVAGNPSSPTPGLVVTVPPTNTITFTPDADASLYAATATTNYGSLQKLEVDNNPLKQFLIRFTVTGVGTRTVTAATLTLTCTDPSPRGGDITVAAPGAWTESTVTWSTAPAAGATIASLGAVVKNTRYTIDLSSVVHGDGVYTLRISTPHQDGADFASREAAAASRPQLVLTLAP